MAVTSYNMRKLVEEAIKISEKALFEATRAHQRLDAIPPPQVPETPQKGERGPQGIPGRDAAPAKDGRDGIGIVGPMGPRGENGRDGRDAPDLSTLRAEWRQDLAAIRIENAELKLMLTAMLESNSKSGQYLAFLRERMQKSLKGQS
jgi:hypothetical protein